MKLEICHVCGKEKKPYLLIVDNNILSFIEYEQAREDGPICERCNSYFAMTGEFKDATEEEFEIAKQAAWFARMMLRWWEKDGKMNPDLPAMRDWEGTTSIATWCRKILSDKQ